MTLRSPLNHPVYVQARQAAIARTDLRFARTPAAPPRPVQRISNAPVRLVSVAQRAGLQASSIPAEPPYTTPGAPPTTPPESPAPPAPPRPEPAGPEITDIPPDTMPVPVREPPVMPQPMAAV